MINFHLPASSSLIIGDNIQMFGEDHVGFNGITYNQFHVRSQQKEPSSVELTSQRSFNQILHKKLKT